MIHIAEDQEYPTVIASFIETLAGLDAFVVRLWTNNSELAMTFTDDDSFMFYDGGIKICHENRIIFVFYDVINGIEVLRGEMFS